MHTRRQRVCRLVGLWVGGGRSSGWIWLSRPSYFFGFSLFSRVARRLHGPLLEFSQSWVPGHRVQGQSWVPGRSLVVVVVVVVVIVVVVVEVVVVVIADGLVGTS